MMGHKISINITLHSEGDLLFKTFKSIAACVKYFKRKNNKVEIISNICLDNPDEETREFCEKSKVFLNEVCDDVKIFTKKFGDPSLSRNFLIDESIKQKVDYIQIMDGDDLFSRNYLLEMYKKAIKYNKPCIVVPEFMLDMDEWTGTLYSRIIKYWPSDDSRQSLTNLYSTNIYQSHIFVDRRVFEKVKYTPNYNEYRFEDYHILLEFLANNYPILVAPKTMRLYRRKANESVLLQHDSNNKLCIAPTRFFSPEIFRKQSYVSVEEFKNKKYDSWAIGDNYTSYDNNEYIRLHKSTLGNILLYSKRLLLELLKIPKKAINKIFRKSKSSYKKQTNYYDKNIERLKKAGFNDFMLNELRFLNTIEPLSIYENRWINFIAVSPITSPKNIDKIYYDICNIKNIEDTTDLLILNHLVSGGADKAMVDLCKTLSKNGRNATIVTTVSGNDTWKDRVNNLRGVNFLSREEYFNEKYINDKDMKIMLLRMVQNWPNLKTLTVMNSGIGYNLLNNYAKEIKKYVRIIVHSWAYYINDQNMIGEPFILSKIYKNIDTLIIDGPAYKDQLMSINGWDGQKIKIVPLMINEVVKKKDFNIKRKICYASRFSMQKRIDCLTHILGDLEKEKITIDFWGNIDETDEVYINKNKDKQFKQINNAQNAVYRGGFNNFNDIPLDDYDLIVLPTQSEGMPNIILEALKSNLYVISGRAGSIPYVIENYKNGFIVDDNGNPAAYRDAIIDFYNNQNRLLSINERFKYNEKVLHDHSKSIYEDNIMEIYGE